MMRKPKSEVLEEMAERGYELAWSRPFTQSNLRKAAELRKKKGFKQGKEVRQRSFDDKVGLFRKVGKEKAMKKLKEVI